METAVAIELPGGRLDGLWVCPEGATHAFVYAHGAGAGMQHAFMSRTADALARNNVATLRYQFPFMQSGRRRPDRAETLYEAVRAAVACGVDRADGLPVFAGGKSMGGRMTSGAHATAPLDGVRGIGFVGFPLHPAGRPGTARAEHLADVDVPMLFLQGTRDKLAELPLLEPVVESLGARGTLHIVDGADHGFHVLKRSGRTDEEVIEELADELGRWMRMV